jgi:putative membrane protein
MKDLAQDFLTQQEQDELVRCVQEVENATSGEIAPVVVSSSYHYPTASHLAALILGIPAALLVCWITGRQDMWTFAAVFLIAYAAALIAANLFPALKRPLISSREMDEEVKEAALTNFHTHGLHRTRDMTGIIIFVSVFERKVWILADKGINDKVDPEVWKVVASELTRRIRDGQPGQALCNAVRRCGELVEEKFPVKHDDTDELPNLIIEGERRD